MSNLVPAPRAYQAKRPRSLRKRAADILRQPGVRMGMVLTSILFLTLWIATIYLVENTWYAVDWLATYAKNPQLYKILDWALYVVDGLVILFVCLPLTYGWIRYMYLAATGAVPPYSIMFAAFANARVYFRTLSIALIFLLQAALPFLLFGGAVALAYLCYNRAALLYYLLCVLCAVVGTALLILGTIANAGSSLIFILDINHPTDSIPRLLRRSRLLCKGRRPEIWLLELSFLPHLIPGVLSLGISLLFHAIPLQMITMQRALLSITGEWLPVVETVPSDR